MRMMFECTHNVCEGAGAAALAAATQEKTRIKGRKVVVIATGGNVDQDVFARVLNQRLTESYHVESDQGSDYLLAIVRNAVLYLQKSRSTKDLHTMVEETERAFADTMAQRDFEKFKTFISEEAVFFSGRNTVTWQAADSRCLGRFFQGSRCTVLLGTGAG